MKKVLRFLLRLIAFVLALILCVLLAVFVVPLAETVDKSPVSGSADWMAKLPDEMLLSEIVIPGTHDSATQYVQLAFFSKCQALSIGEQLDAGFRYLDIRLGIDNETDALQLMHGFTRCKTGVFSKTLLLNDVLDACYGFLDAHPTETVIFAVKQEHGNESVGEFETRLDAIIREDESRWLLSDTLPALGQARGKLVLLRRYEDEAALGERAGVPFLWANQNGSADLSLHAAAEDNGGYTLWVQDRYEYGSEDKWNAFTAGMEAVRERAQGDIAVHFLSTKGTLAYGHPYLFAKPLNQKLMEADLALDGWIIVDFASAPLAERIWSANA